MTEQTELVEKVDAQYVGISDELDAKKFYTIYWRKWCVGGVHFPPWDELDWLTKLHIKEAIKTAIPLIQQQERENVLRDMLNSHGAMEAGQQKVNLSTKPGQYEYLSIREVQAIVRAVAETYVKERKLTQGEGQ